MANYFPLVLDKNTPKLQELSAGDTLDLTGSLLQLQTGTISSTPTSSTDIANKAYVDAVANGLNFHAAVDYATTAALGSYTYSNGTNGVGATLTGANGAALTIDGHLLTSTDVTNGTRILVKNETGTYTNNTTMSAAFNGVYKVTAVSTSGSNAWVLTRTTDFDTAGSGANEIDAGDFMYILSGTANANSSWIQQNKSVTVGTSAITFVQFSASGGGSTVTVNGFSSSTGVVTGVVGTPVEGGDLGFNNSIYWNICAVDANGNSTRPQDGGFYTYVALPYGQPTYQSIQFSWDAYPNAVAYKIYVQSGTNQYSVATTTSTTYTLTTVAGLPTITGTQFWAQVADNSGLKVHGYSRHFDGIDANGIVQTIATASSTSPQLRIDNSYNSNAANSYTPVSYFIAGFPTSTLVPYLRGAYYDAYDWAWYDTQLRVAGIDIGSSTIRSRGGPGLSLPSNSGNLGDVLTVAEGGSVWTWGGGNTKYWRKNTAVTLSSATGNQSIFGNNISTNTGVFLRTPDGNSNWGYIYEVDGEFTLTTTGTTSHTESFGFYLRNSANGSSNTWNATLTVTRTDLSTTASTVRTVRFTNSTPQTILPATTSAQSAVYRVRGHLIIPNDSFAYLSPVIAFSAAPGGTSTIEAGAWMKFTPVSSYNADTLIGGTIYV